MTEPTKRELQYWRQMEQLIRHIIGHVQPDIDAEEADIDAEEADELRQIVLDLDYERHVR
ncbi:hypothetical protein LCGC14_0823560 [marine sediment metagenome]|uniref:Uncharacterized protein n=1 Tax=marine sediment metagenome TaxID=412755 RepID=A0A0F9SQN1_9ZZZZ